MFCFLFMRGRTLILWHFSRRAAVYALSIKFKLFLMMLNYHITQFGLLSHGIITTALWFDHNKQNDGKATAMQMSAFICCIVALDYTTNAGALWDFRSYIIIRKYNYSLSDINFNLVIIWLSSEFWYFKQNVLFVKFKTFCTFWIYPYFYQLFSKHPRASTTAILLQIQQRYVTDTLCAACVNI